MSAAVNIYCLVAMGVYHYGLVPERITLTTAAWTVGILAAAVAALFSYLTKRRLQDLNFPPIWATLMAFPLLAVILLPVLCFFTPVRVPNRFGRPPLPSGKLKVTAALAGFVLALVLVPMVAQLYAPLHLQILL
jgi:uncharacterized membrane protein YhaH (DUF805 family)